MATAMTQTQMMEEGTALRPDALMNCEWPSSHDMGRTAESMAGGRLGGERGPYAGPQGWSRLRLIVWAAAAGRSHQLQHQKAERCLLDRRRR